MATSDMAAPSWSARRALWIALAIAGVVAALDQASKWIVVAAIMRPPRVIEVTPFFNLVLTYNPGVSFGLLGGAAAWKPWALSALAIFVVAVLLRWLTRQPDPLLAVAIGLVSGGAIGNMIDRIHSGAVVDFLDFHFGGWHWWAFNLADSAITVGIVLLVFDGLFRPQSRSNSGGEEAKSKI